MTARRITSQTALQGEQLLLGKQDVRRRLQEEPEEYQQWPAEGRRRSQRTEQILLDKQDVRRVNGDVSIRNHYPRESPDATLSLVFLSTINNESSCAQS